MMKWDLAGSSPGDSSKGSGSSLGARREITRRRPDDLSQECRRLPDWRKLGLSLRLCFCKCCVKIVVTSLPRFPHKTTCFPSPFIRFEVLFFIFLNRFLQQWSWLQGDWLVIDGARGLCTSRVMILVLRASWFSLSY
ncbi:hypothetical protein B296_00008384 [Ensete ventricosum]|uniref:Uncharacterized protein n=1 Tax=Ensete ventricosum TaxID=4639 RepID=A0A426YZM1_ENSVE|nr:hypothetical protein B296_00008384 [Ensete ventricosum]